MFEGIETYNVAQLRLCIIKLLLEIFCLTHHRVNTTLA
jgi:hypothetical protein